ncbi:MAG: hypothetical protein AB7D05_08185 [Mangrovibacterium sp.]
MEDRRIDKSTIPRENPFRVPEAYFDSLEDRIEELIPAKTREDRRPARQLIRLLKPVAGLAASFALAFLLIHYPLSKILPNYSEGKASTPDGVAEEEVLLDYELFNERVFYHALTSPEDISGFETDTLMTYLSAELDDYDMLTEIMN